MALKETKQPAKKSPAVGVASSKGRRITGQKARGVVRTIMGEGQKGKTSASMLSPARLVEMINAGLPVQELHDLQATLSLPIERLAPMLGISKATFHRRKASQVLEPSESDRVVRFARLMSQAIDVFETEQNARQWLSSPQVGLGGKVPLDYARTEVGAREVEYLLGRIEYGVYS